MMLYKFDGEEAFRVFGLPVIAAAIVGVLAFVGSCKEPITVSAAPTAGAVTYEVEAPPPTKWIADVYIGGKLIEHYNMLDRPPQIRHMRMKNSEPDAPDPRNDTNDALTIGWMGAHMQAVTMYEITIGPPHNQVIQTTDKFTIRFIETPQN